MASKTSQYQRVKKQRNEEEKNGVYQGVGANTLDQLKALTDGRDKKQIEAVFASSEIRVGAFLFTPTGLDVSEEASEADWNEVGKILAYLDSALQWLIGDWANWYVERQSPKDDNERGRLYDEICEMFNLERPKTVRNYALVCRKVHVSLRKDTLSFSHHNLVTGLDEDWQEIWLSRAEKENWSVAEMSRQMQNEGDSKTLPDIDIAFKSADRAFMRAKKMDKAQRRKLANYLRQKAEEIEAL
jgi:hypothetical protein